MDWSFLTKRKTDTLCVSTDTRNLPQGCVFFALHGDSFDGNTFAAQALEMGAEYAVSVDACVVTVATAKQKSKNKRIFMVLLFY